LARAGVLKVVFATETLAAGINMPARATVIASLSRRRAAGVDGLTHNELLQMAGRAGRRGYDTAGAREGAAAACALACYCSGTALSLDAPCRC
jgi:superfamily II RNA helicase